MALNGKYISLNSIMEQVYADNGYQFELPWIDCMQWAEEALNLIGHPRQYIRKVTGHKANPDLDIKNYRAHLPCDFYSLEQVAVNGMPAEYSGDTFHHLMDGACCGIEGYANLAAHVQEKNWGTLVKVTETDGAYRYEQRDEAEMDNLNLDYSGTMAFDMTANMHGEYTPITFDLNNNHITLSVKEGQVCMAYLAVPTDEEGLPLIPEDTSYQLAVKKYLTMKIDYIAWRRGQLASGIYEHSEREWMWYVGQAGNKAKMPNIDQLEAIKNMTMRLLPNINHHETFFKNLGSAEIRNNFNR
ncbi:MAG TPA: hypothetical protein DCX01_04450 [Bacteroidetes bacterium]|nr:hypothetical protein [Bacteroidota bacterium]